MLVVCSTLNTRGRGTPGKGLNSLIYHFICVIKVAGLRSSGLEFELLSAIELSPGGVDSACHPSEVSKMSTSGLVMEGTASAAQPCLQKMM